MISKSNYFSGVLITHLLSNRILNTAPVLCEESDDIKSLSFISDYGEYELYIKYSTSFNKNKKEERNCNFIFEDQEIEKIKSYTISNKNFYIAFVCTNEKLTKTEIAILYPNDVLRILGNDSVNERRRLSIRHKKCSEYLCISGTNLDIGKAKIVKKDVNIFFRKREDYVK